MTGRKPNNLPWIILGGICCLGLLGLFGFGVYSGAKGVSDEMSITFPEQPEPAASSETDSKQIIFVDGTNHIFFDYKAVEDFAALKSVLKSFDDETLKSTVFILKISEDSSHTRLIEIKDMLDSLKVRSIIEVVRSDAE